jgi:hypothetical protein
VTVSWPHWTTPPSVLDRVRVVSAIALDPCSNDASQVVAHRRCTGAKDEGDGLVADWGELSFDGLVFVNPPYGRQDLARWVDKMVAEAAAGCEIVALLPSSTGTKWFAKIAASAQAVCFWGPGRLSFGNPPAGKANDNPSIDNLVAYWGPHAFRFLAAFADVGHGFPLPRRI